MKSVFAPPGFAKGSPFAGRRGWKAAAPAFTPASVAGFTTWVSGRQGNWQDAAKTVPAVNDGDRVWASGTGGGNALANAGGAQRPTLKLNVHAGRPVLRFDGVANFLSRTGGELTSTAAFTVIWSGTFSGSSGTLWTGQNSSTGASYKQLLVNSATSVTTFVQNDAASFVQNPSPSDNAWHVWTLKWDGSTVTLYKDGTLVNSRTIASPITCDEWALGMDLRVSTWAACDAGDCAWYSTALSDANRNLVEAYMA